MSIKLGVLVGWLGGWVITIKCWYRAFLWFDFSEPVSPRLVWHGPTTDSSNHPSLWKNIQCGVVCISLYHVNTYRTVFVNFSHQMFVCSDRLSSRWQDDCRANSKFLHFPNPKDRLDDITSTSEWPKTRKRPKRSNWRKQIEPKQLSTWISDEKHTILTFESWCWLGRHATLFA